MIPQDVLNSISDPWELFGFIDDYSEYLHDYSPGFNPEDDAIYDRYDYKHRVIDCLLEDDLTFEEMARYLRNIPQCEDAEYFRQDYWGGFYTFDFLEEYASLKAFIRSNFTLSDDGMWIKEEGESIQRVEQDRSGTAEEYTTEEPIGVIDDINELLEGIA